MKAVRASSVETKDGVERDPMAVDFSLFRDRGENLKDVHIHFGGRDPRASDGVL
jgi:hypothetical protein